MLNALGIALAGLSVVPQLTVAQTTAKASCLSGFEWSFNSEGDDPCTIAMDLAGVCIGTDFTLAPLDPGFVYLGPDSANANSCRCSSVYYSLLSACANCQDRNYINWSIYKSNCTVVYSQVFLQPIPQGVGVPHYAYLDVETSDTFNVTAASLAGGPESTSIPQSTATSASGTSHVTATSPVVSGGKKSNAGAIAGGVVGGIVGLALIGGLVFWLLRRRRAPPTPPVSYDPANMVAPPQQPAMTGTTYAPTYAPPMAQKVYDPNDPSTFPMNNDTSTGSFNPYNGSSTDPSFSQVYPAQMSQHFTGNNTAGSFPQTPTRPHYTGAPEL